MGRRLSSLMMSEATASEGIDKHFDESARSIWQFLADSFQFRQ